jgi:ABC-type phosphate transport system substrate-binding protein
MPISQKMATGLLVAGLFATSIPAFADVVVIVSAKSTASTITEEQAADIFLGKANTLPGGGQAVPVDQPDGSLVRELFYFKVTGKTGAQLKAYWSKQIFSGKGQPPKEAGDNAAVKSLVAGNPNIVGYIDKSVVDATVKVLLTVK